MASLYVTASFWQTGLDVAVEADGEFPLEALPSVRSHFIGSPFLANPKWTGSAEPVRAGFPQAQLASRQHNE
jgi:hypothetical protein